MRSSLTDKQAGFTLLEILVAIMVFSLLTLTSNMVLSLVRNNIQQQVLLTKNFTLRQYTINLLMNDFLHAEFSHQYPLKISKNNKNCSQEISFFTRNQPNVYSQYVDPLFQVTWNFSVDGITRITPLSSGNAKVQTLLGQAKCFDFRIFKDNQWQQAETIQTLPQAISFNLSLSNKYNIERFIPMFQRDDNQRVSENEQ